MKKPFPRKLRLERTGPGTAVLMETFVFNSPTQGRIVVEEGFDTDYASIPRIFWNILPPDGEYSEGAVIHDSEYWFQTREREVADLILLEAMEALGVSWIKRQTIYRAVRAFGWMAWNENRRKRLAGLIA